MKNQADIIQDQDASPDELRAGLEAADGAPCAEEEFQIAVRKLEAPARPRGVLAE